MSDYQPLTDLFKRETIIGKGAFGSVYKAKTKPGFSGIPINTTVAIKLIDLSRIKPKDIIDLRNEVDILSRLSSYQDNSCHQNILCYYGSANVIDNGKKYFAIVTELLEGYSLSNYVEDLIKEVENPVTKEIEPVYTITSSLTDQQLADLMKQLLIALDYMHSANVVHRDIKADNIIYLPEKQIIKYIDFGFSCFNTLEKIIGQCIFKARGTPEFMSPELLNAAFSIDPETAIVVQNKEEVEKLFKSDVWSLAIVFSVLIGGTVPYPDFDNVEDLANFIITDGPQIPDFDGDPFFLTVLAYMLEKDYQKRPTAKMAYDYIEKKFPTK